MLGIAAPQVSRLWVFATENGETLSEIFSNRLFRDGWIAAWTLGIIVIFSLITERLVPGKRNRRTEDRANNYEKAFHNVVEARRLESVSSTEVVSELAKVVTETAKVVREMQATVESKSQTVPVEIMEPVHFTLDQVTPEPDGRGDANAADNG